MPTTTRFTDALSGLFQNPLFLLGANLAALSGSQRFPQALGGAALKTSGLMAEVTQAAQREQAREEELGLRQKYLGMAEEEAQAEKQSREAKTQAYSQLQAALAGLEGDPLRRALILYQLATGGGLSGLLGETKPPFTAYQDWQINRAEGEAQRREAERSRKAELTQAEIARIRARPDLSEDEKQSLIYDLEMGRPPRPLEDPMTVRTRELMRTMGQGGGAAGGRAPETPAPGGGFLDALRGWWRGEPSAGVALPPAAPATGSVSLGTPLTPPASAPGDSLAGFEAALPSLNPTQRREAKAHLQSLLADPAMAGLRARIEALLRQL
jgi:hypothetical protein